MSEPSQYDTDLDKNAANYTQLSPLTFIERAAAVYPERVAQIHGERRLTWGETYTRCRRLASPLQRHGVGENDTVALMLPNVPAMFEAHFAIPMAGAVINALNIRLDAEAIAFQLKHGGARILITDREFSSTIKAALAQLPSAIQVIDVDDPAAGDGELIGDIEDEDFIGSGDPVYEKAPPSRKRQYDVRDRIRRRRVRLAEPL